MSTNSKSIIVLLSLLAVLTFLVGFRLGRRVEKVDQAYIPPTSTPITQPTTTPQPTQQTQNYATFINENCNFTFLYPSVLEEIAISSQEARLVSRNQSVRVLCNAPESELQDIQLTEPQDSIAVSGVSVPLYQTQDNSQILTVEDGQSISLLEVPDDLAPLIFKTLEIIE